MFNFVSVQDLLISSVSPEDSGSYRCLVVNPFGRVLSQEARLHVECESVSCLCTSVFGLVLCVQDSVATLRLFGLAFSRYS